MTPIAQSAGSLHTIYVNGQIFRQCFWDKDTGEWLYKFTWKDKNGNETELSGIRRTKISIPKLEQMVKAKTGIAPRKLTVPVPFLTL